MAKQKAALLTAGGLAPCLSSAVGGLIERYSDVAPEIELIAYRSGYQGVLLGDSIEIAKTMREKAHLLHSYGRRSATAASSSPTSPTASNAAWSRKEKIRCVSPPSG